MEASFAEAIRLVGRLRELGDEQLTILERVDEACQELYLSGFEHYLARKCNEETPRLLKKYNLTGLTVSQEYGGSGKIPCPARQTHRQGFRRNLQDAFSSPKSTTNSSLSG